MRKNWVMRISYIFLAVTVFLFSMVGSSYAKYTSTANSSDSARVAKFHIRTEGFNGDNTVPLFNTAYMGEGENAGNATVSSVKEVIAPGTQGDFTLYVYNESEVVVEYFFNVIETITPLNANIPIYYKVGDDNPWVTRDDLPTQLTGVINIGGMDSCTVYWKWLFDEDESTAYGQTNSHDTVLGFAGSAKVDVKLSITVNQVD